MILGGCNPAGRTNVDQIKKLTGAPTLFDTDLSNLDQIGVALKDFFNTVLFQRAHPLLHRRIPHKLHGRFLLDQPLYLVACDQELMNRHTTKISRVVALGMLIIKTAEILQGA